VAGTNSCSFALVLKSSRANAMKIIFLSDSFHPEKRTNIPSVMFVVRNWKIKLSFQIS
jgi:hypothetical protein